MTTLSSRNWFGKASAGLVLGYVLSIGLAGLVFFLGHPGGSDKLQFVMWAVAPVWCLVLGFCFLFRSGRRAWMWLGAASAAVWLAQLALRGFGG